MSSFNSDLSSIKFSFGEYEVLERIINKDIFAGRGVVMITADDERLKALSEVKEAEDILEKLRAAV